MANDNDIPLNITADASDATKTIDKFTETLTKALEKIDKSLTDNIQKPLEGIEKQTVKSTGKMESAFNSLKVVAGAALAIFAGKAIINGLSNIVSEASEADQNVRKLGAAMALTGEFTDKAVDRFADFASELQKTTTFTDDAILQAAALAKNFGLTNDQAEKLTKAAVDLSAATGQDLNSAVQQLGATFSGTAGKLSKVTPALKGLTEEQLKAGAAIDIVANKFKGFAETTAQTFGGASTITKNAFGEIFESLGKIITQNPVVIAVIQQLGKAFQAIGSFIDENKDSITQLLSKGLKALVSFLPKVIDGFTLLVAILSVVVDITADLVQLFLFFGKTIFEITKPIRDLVNILGNAFLGVVSKVLSSILSLANAVPGVSSSLKGLGINLDDIQKTVSEFSDNRISDALALDTSVSDSYQKFVTETIDDVSALTESARDGSKSVLEVVGVGSAKVADYARNAASEINKVGDSAVKVTAGIKNLNKEFDNSDNIAKLLESVKGSFEKVKGAIDGLQQEIDKQTLSARKLIDADEARAKQLFKNATLELQLTGKITKAQKEQLDNIDNLSEAERNSLKEQLGANNGLLVQYDQLIKKKADLARQKLGIGDLTIVEAFKSITGSISSFGSAIGKLASIDFSGEGSDVGGSVAESFLTAAVDGASAIGEAIGDVTLGDIASGAEKVAGFLSDAFDIGAQVFTGIFTGSFIKTGFDVVQTFLQFPKALLAVFKDFGGIVDELLASLPNIITEIINQLPQLAVKIADGIGKLVDLLVENAPKIFESIIKSIETIVDKLVEKLPAIANVIGDAIVKSTESFANKLPSIITALASALGTILQKVLGEALPKLIDALPAVFKAIFDALPGLIKVILGAVPKILDSIFKALPGIVKAIADAIPDIILAIVDSLPDIIQSLLEGILTAIPEIIDALITSFLVEGGLERLVVGLIKASPRIALALAKGLINGLVGGSKASFAALGKYFTSGFGNIFEKLGSGFGISAGGGIKNAFNIGSLSFFSKVPQFFQGILTTFQTAANNLFTGIRNVFSQVSTQLFSTIINAFAGIFGQLYSAITGAFYSIFGSLYGTIVGAFNSIFGSLYATIVNAFSNIFGPLYQTIVNGFNNIFGGIGDAIANGGERLKNAFFEPVNRLIDFLNNFSFSGLTGGSGGLGGILSKIPGGSVVGGAVGGVVGALGGGGGGGLFASGGIVPSGFPNDSFPARLTSGEMVLPPDLASGLQSLISGSSQQASNGNDSTLLATILSQISAKLDKPVNAEATVQIDGRAFAQIILDLTRNNARLVA